MPNAIFLSGMPLNASFNSESVSLKDKDVKRLEESCSDMESLFIQYLLEEMRATVPKSGFLSGGRAEEMYTSIFDVQLAKEIAGRKEIGISSMLFQQLRDSIQNDEKGND